MTIKNKPNLVLSRLLKNANYRYIDASSENRSDN